MPSLMIGLLIFVYMIIGIAFMYSTYIFMEEDIKSDSYKYVNLSLITVGLFWPITLVVILLLKLFKA